MVQSRSLSHEPPTGGIPRMDTSRPRPGWLRAPSSLGPHEVQLYHCAGEIHGNPGKFYGDLNGKIYGQTMGTPMGTPMGNWVFFNGALEKSLTSEFRINLR
jgi:hypothetical protein